MPDIYISHVAENREAARQLAQALEKKGWSVWWNDTKNDKLATVKSEDMLRSAKAVVVLWTCFSATDRYVIREAQEALARGVLFPVLLEDVFLSSPFDDQDTSNLIQWNGEAAHPEFQRLTESIKVVVQPTASLDPVKNSSVSSEAGEVSRYDAVSSAEPIDHPSPTAAKPDEVVIHDVASKRINKLWVLFKQRKYLVYGGLVLLIVLVFLSTIRKPSEKIEHSQAEAVPISQAKELEESDNPKTLGLAGKQITLDVSEKNQNNEVQPNPVNDGDQSNLQPELEKSVTKASQPKVYYPPAPKEPVDNGLNLPVEESEANITDSITSEPGITLLNTTDSLAVEADSNPMIKPGSFYTTTQIGGEFVRDFSVGDKVFIRATVYPTENETLKLEWLTNDNHLIGEKRIGAVNPGGLTIYDSRQQFPGNSGEFKARLYNGQDLLAETTFTIN